jgi:hypothetical protein
MRVASLLCAAVLIACAGCLSPPAESRRRACGCPCTRDLSNRDILWVPYDQASLRRLCNSVPLSSYDEDSPFED